MKKNIYFYTNLLAWGLVLFLIGNYAFGWTTPSVSPPDDNLPAPINLDNWREFDNRRFYDVSRSRGR